MIRGARQVGKATLIRLFAEASFDALVELNFERDPDLAQLFLSNDPWQILSLLELRLDRSIRPGSSLLFLDEIQAAPEVLPDAVQSYVASGSFRDSAIVKESILTTFKEDFAKYGSRASHARLRKVFERLPALVGGKLKYSQIEPEDRSKNSPRPFVCSVWPGSRSEPIAPRPMASRWRPKPMIASSSPCSSMSV